MTDLPRLRRLLGGPETAWLVDRVRERLSTGRALDTPVALRTATVEQRRAIELLLGRRLRSGTSLTVPLAEVDRVLRESLACPDGLAAAVVALAGPVTDRRAQDARLSAAWQQAWAVLDHPTVTERPELASWRAKVEATGLLKRLSGGDPAAARRLAADAVPVLSQLPADGLTLPAFSARTLGDAHALDEGRPLATLVHSAVRALAGPPADAMSGAAGRRAAWAAVGVALDELSSRALTLGLPGSTVGTTGRILAAAHEGGEPCLLTLRQLTGQPPRLGLAGRLVHVCENPAVLAAAADELGPDCPPLICVEGNLSVAARTLLTRIADQGCPIAYHGDFDWGGIRIATGVLRLPGATPWRYDAPSYLAAVDRGLGTPLTTGTPTPTPWDPALAAAVTGHAIRIEEEHLLDQLLADLRRQTVQH
ncbi:TIGR02679 family protein [Kitasatospora aureofaciens]|uniref:TIGR02679 family protein n=1 Tax=Kitasatospora aureofaciens TaxID=1894 RepID=UPI001C45EF63|nr:TIGR02679 family protein [Kitasatospora aureofaciens]MBV6696989.1 TIGR02679 family protein [Kitasatospora aureofaciens]